MKGWQNLTRVRLDLLKRSGLHDRAGYFLLVLWQAFPRRSTKLWVKAQWKVSVLLQLLLFDLFVLYVFSLLHICDHLTAGFKQSVFINKYTELQNTSLHRITNQTILPISWSPSRDEGAVVGCPTICPPLETPLPPPITQYATTHTSQWSFKGLNMLLSRSSLCAPYVLSGSKEIWK